MVEFKDFKKICLFCPVAILSDYSTQESETLQHLKSSKKELLLAIRSLIDEAISLLEKEKPKGKAKKIKVE